MIFDVKRWQGFHKKLAHYVVPMWRLLIFFLKMLGRLKCPPGISTSQKVDMFMPLYRYRSSEVHLVNALSDEVNRHMTTIERELIKKVKRVEKDVSKDSNRLDEIKLVSQEDSKTVLERCVDASESINAIAHEQVTEIQCIVDKVREYTDRRKFYAMKQAVEDAILRIQSFHDEFSRPVPDEIFSVLGSGINTHLLSLEAMRKAVERVVSIRHLPEANSSPEHLRIWAESLESFAEEFEDNQEFFSFEVFSSLEVLATEIVLQCRVKKPLAAGSESENYRRRIRYAAGFLLNVIEASQEEAEEEDEEVISSLSRMGGLTLNDMLPSEEGGNCHDQNCHKD